VERVTRRGGWSTEAHHPTKIIARSTDQLFAHAHSRRPAPDDNYSWVISHFICKIASTDRRHKFPPLKYSGEQQRSRRNGRTAGTHRQTDTHTERHRESDILWMNGSIAAAES